MSLYDKLAAHFNEASRKYPIHKFIFDQQLDVYKGALINNDPICKIILQKETTPIPNGTEKYKYSGDVSAYPERVTEVLNAARRIYIQGLKP
jgi:hypothetical protein